MPDPTRQPSPHPPPPDPPSPNAFAEEFLRRLAEEDEPPFAEEADFAGPWRVLPAANGRFAVLRRWEAPEAGDEPHAVFDSYHLALLAAAVLPTLGAGPDLLLDGEAAEAGYPLWSGPKVAGHLRYFHVELVEALQLARALTASPEALATLLEAAGATALRHAGRVLRRRTDEREA